MKENGIDSGSIVAQRAGVAVYVSAASGAGEGRRGPTSQSEIKKDTVTLKIVGKFTSSG